MTEYWQNAWLIGLTLTLVALAIVVALDLKREWSRTADPRLRRLIADALQERELEQETGSHPMPKLEALMAEPAPWDETVQADRFEPAEPATEPTPSAGDLLVGPPMVGQDTLRDWLIHYRKDGDVWSDVVREFYRRAAGAPTVADYFGGHVTTDGEIDPALQRHFTAALVLITHTGVTRGLPAIAAGWHNGVRNSAGDPITPEVFDAVTATLVGVLRDFDVPDAALEQLGATVAPFRMAIARERVPSPEQRARAEWPAWRGQRGPSVTEEG
jgi:hypothetical protein